MRRLQFFEVFLVILDFHFPEFYSVPPCPIVGAREQAFLLFYDRELLALIRDFSTSFAIRDHWCDHSFCDLLPDWLLVYLDQGWMYLTVGLTDRLRPFSLGDWSILCSNLNWTWLLRKWLLAFLAFPWSVSVAELPCSYSFHFEAYWDPFEASWKILLNSSVRRCGL